MTISSDSKYVVLARHLCLCACVLVCLEAWSLLTSSSCLRRGGAVRLLRLCPVSMRASLVCLCLYLVSVLVCLCACVRDCDCDCVCVCL